jgi:hypothetical protein
MSHIGGPLLLTNYITTMKDYNENDATKVSACLEQAIQHLLAYIYLDNSDRTKYGTQPIS